MIAPTIKGMKKTIVTAFAVSFTGVVILVLLLSLKLIGELSFSSLLTIITLESLFIAFSDRVTSINLKELSMTLAEIQSIQQAVVAKQIEPVRMGGGYAMLPSLKGKAHDIDNDTIIIAKTILDTEYAFRNFNGIVADSNLPEKVVKDKIDWLLNKKYVNKFYIDGMELFALSATGRDVMFWHL
jgi:hypothetical protein